ncbi:uncharacterized protein PV07_02800 [Cladophialophora immunda]|uniref:DH domain-containing protein n=1 Tax=Cladophialophora immunda TaxID=569365 RepID=A0A0D2B0M2_9EURO|nr:uncharacterized protein PV07_02800 [Cladophialophora immunda]KIW31122.1 hypothetical protein PV07_02800 [Cladophialophora immunda]OQV00065.1 RhoGEF domain-containing protein [Cladophialophora immunda]
MTAQLLPSVITSPFSRHFDTRANIFSGSWTAYPSRPTLSSTSLKPFCIHQDPQTSSASNLSISSAPVQVNKRDRDLPCSENILPGIPLPSPELSSTNGLKLHSKHYESLPIAEDSKLRSLQPTHSDVRVASRPTQGYLASPSQARQPLAELHNAEKRTHGVHHDIGAGNREHNRLRTSLSTEACFTEQEKRCDLSTHPREHTRDWFSAVDETPQSLIETPFLADTSDDTSKAGLHSGLHRKRHSTASSGFVHTMKTASLSNASFSLVPRSLRMGRSTDSTYIFSSNARLSVESDRPSTSASVDEAAFRRAIKRRQILVELITTEESYIADLKALIYLYSTLLATITVTCRVRSSVLRNVHDLLSVHERLLERLHQAAYEAAARKWADTTSPRHLGSPPYHKRWRSLESSVAAKIGRSHRRTRSSMESSEMSRSRTYLGGAEPRDVADAAGIFRDFLSDFLVYEEYCANHSLISHELQRHSPTLWSTYESGIESLARSLVALDHKHQSERKGLTVGDLLIKPIQRMTKYPLLFEDLLRQTHVADCPSAHADLEAILMCLREVVQTVNKATDNHETRTQIQRRWSIQTRLICDQVSLRAEQLRMLGNIQLSGVLHVTWQTRNNRVDGRYALCLLFDTSLIIALPAGATPKFDVIAFLHLRDTRIESASDGRGLQCHSTLYTWKICFEIGGHLHEFILSACSAIEENAWRGGLQNKDAPGRRMEEQLNQIPSSISLNLRSIGQVYSQQSSTLSRNPSVQRAATVGNRTNVCQVIIRNTNNPQDLHEFRQPSSSAINRSQSHMTSNRVVVLAPKRSERARLESSLSDVWTKEKLPYPGMIGSRGGQIIRASAGSLVRKLSLASIHAPFSRRSGSLSLTSRKSFDLSNESRRSRTKHATPVFEVRKESLDEMTPARTKSREIPEVDTMDNVVSRMIGSSVSRKLSISQGHHALARRGTKSQKISQDAGGAEVGPEDPAEIYYAEVKEVPEKPEIVEEGLAGRKKRWSNPLGILKVLSADGLRHMLYSSK